MTFYRYEVRFSEDYYQTYIIDASFLPKKLFEKGEKWVPGYYYDGQQARDNYINIERVREFRKMDKISPQEYKEIQKLREKMKEEG